MKQILVIGVALSFAAPFAAFGQSLSFTSKDPNKPIQVTADQGIEWQQTDKRFIARGNAKATQGDINVTADELTAHYRETKSGATEVYRVDAIGRVTIASKDETASGAAAVYDFDKEVLVIEGSPVTLSTPTGKVTAQQAIQYWSKEKVAVAEGDAEAQDETRDIKADKLTAFFAEAKPGADKSSMRQGDIRLVVANLGKTYKGRPVLRDVSMSVQRGEAVGLLGPNGAGKTTSFYCVTGLISPDKGKIYLDGQDITALPMYRRARLGIGYLPQEASIFRGMTVEGNIRAVAEIVEEEKAAQDALVEALMKEFSIDHLRKSPALSLSGGERRRCEIARALASRPSFILLDEPLAGIDPIAVAEIREMVSHLKDRGLGVLITDHNVRETLDIIDRAYILHEGTVLMEGTPSEIVAHEGVRRVYLGERFSL